MNEIVIALTKTDIDIIGILNEEEGKIEDIFRIQDEPSMEGMNPMIRTFRSTVLSTNERGIRKQFSISLDRIRKYEKLSEMNLPGRYQEIFKEIYELMHNQKKMIFENKEEIG